jgi:hypothetical protein
MVRETGPDASLNGRSERNRSASRLCSWKRRDFVNLTRSGYNLRHMPKPVIGSWATPEFTSFSTKSSGENEREAAATKSEPYAGEEAGAARTVSAENAWEKQQASTEVRVHDFRRTSEVLYENLRADLFIRTIESFLEVAETATEEGVESEDLDGKFRKKILPLGEKRLGKKQQPLYQAWVEEQLSSHDSRLWGVYEAWAEKTVLALSAKTAQQQTERLSLQESLSKIFPSLRVAKRIKAIERHLAEMAANPSFPGEEVFKLFLVDQAWQEWDKEQGRKPSFFEKLMGKPAKTPEDFLDQLLDGLSPDYALATDQFGVTRKEKLKGTISSKDIQPTGKGKRPKPPKDEESTAAHAGGLRSMRDMLDGSLDTKGKLREPRIQGLEEYKKRLKLTPEFDRCLDAIRPVLGRRSLIREVDFKDDFARDHRDAQFDHEDLRIDVFPEKMDQARVAFSLMHEAGHAISPDKTLSLKDSIAFSVEMVDTIKKTGFISNYSLASMFMVGAQMDKERTFRTEEEIEFVTERPMDEEWAEMMANAMTAPVTEHVYPEKYDMVRRWIAKFGIDLQSAQQDVMAAVMGQAHEQLKRQAADESASPESGKQDAGRETSTAA